MKIKTFLFSMVLCCFIFACEDRGGESCGHSNSDTTSNNCANNETVAYCHLDQDADGFFTAQAQEFKKNCPYYGVSDSEFYFNPDLNQYPDCNDQDAEIYPGQGCPS